MPPLGKALMDLSVDFGASTNQYMTDLLHTGDYPVVAPISVVLSDSTSSVLETACNLLNIYQFYPLTEQVVHFLWICANARPSNTTLAARVVGISDGNVSYSDTHYFQVRDRSRLYADLIEPVARRAILRFDDNFTGGGLNLNTLKLVDPGLGYDEETMQFSILSATV